MSVFNLPRNRTNTRDSPNSAEAEASPRWVAKERSILVGNLVGRKGSNMRDACGASTKILVAVSSRTHDSQ